MSSKDGGEDISACPHGWQHTAHLLLFLVCGAKSDKGRVSHYSLVAVYLVPASTALQPENVLVASPLGTTDYLSSSGVRDTEQGRCARCSNGPVCATRRRWSWKDMGGLERRSLGIIVRHNGQDICKPSDGHLGRQIENHVRYARRRHKRGT